MNRFLNDVKSWAVEMIRQAEPPDKTKLLDPARTHTEILLALSDEEPYRDQGEMAEKPARPPTPEQPDTDQTDTQPQQISRLNSLSERVTKVTGNTKKFIMSQKTVTPATKKTLDGVLIDGRLTEPTGILYKAKMIGSLSVQFHKGDKMAIDAMRDLKVMAKTSGRHKARIYLRISIQGIHILEDSSMKQIDIHDLDKISYLAEDPEEKKVFGYIYNKTIRNKDSGKTTTVHRLFAIKSPKCMLIVSNMKAVFHYMYDMRMSDNKPDSTNVDMALVKQQAEEEKKEASAPPEQDETGSLIPSDEEGDTLGFGYGKLLDLTEPEQLIQPVVAADPELYPEEETGTRSELDPGPAVNLYVTAPRGNKLEVMEEPDEPVYSTVRKIREDDPQGAPARPGPPRIEVTSDFGTVNPSWNKSAHNSDNEEDIFSLDKYNRRESTSSDSEEEHTFGVTPPAPAKIQSAVFLDNQEYEWDIGETPNRYNEGQFELSESRERLSTVTKKAVASLERVRDDQKPAPATQTGGSLIDFATFEDRLETSDPVDLFDTLKEKPKTTAPQNDDLLSLDFSGFGASPAPTQQKQATVQPSVETEKYNIDINSLLADPNTYKNSSIAGSTQSLNSTTGQQGGWVGFSLPPAGNTATQGASTFTGPNYQPNYNFPVSFGAPTDNLLNTTSAASSRKTSTASNPFREPKTTTTSSTFDPFSDLMNDAI